MIKRNKLKGFLAGVVATALIPLSVPAFASTVDQQITVTYNGIKVTLNGQQIPLKDANSNTVTPFSYNQTVYLPVRAISQALGLTVSYDGATKTVSLTGSASNGTQPAGTPPTGTPPTGTPPTGTAPTDTPSTDTSSSSVDKQITVTYNDIKVTLNGQQLSLKDVNGNAVDPFSYNQTVFLPIRAISQALGLTVSYEGTTKAVSLTGSNGQSSPPNGSSAPDLSKLIESAKTTLASLVSN